MPQIILIPRRLTNSLPPLLNRLENAMLDPCGPHRRALGEPTDKLIEEFLGADLQVEGVAAVLDADVEELYRCPLVGVQLCLRRPCAREGAGEAMCPTAKANNETFWLRELIKRTMSNAASRGL